MVGQIKENCFVIALSAVGFAFLQGYARAHWGLASSYIFVALLLSFSVLTDTSMRQYANLVRDLSIGISTCFLLNLFRFLS